MLPRQSITFLKERFAEGRFKIDVQILPKSMVRTTDRNFVITVPGKSTEKIILVAHYDTWAGFSNNAPGADDNTSGEEVLKHYLLRDLISEALSSLDKFGSGAEPLREIARYLLKRRS